MKNINKIMIVGLILLVLPSMVIAGSINGADYYDGDWNLIWDNGQMRELNDNDVDIDADTVGGKSVQNLKHIMDRKDRRILNEANSYADSHDSSGSSFDKEDMLKYLYGEEYETYLDARYIQIFDFATIALYNQAYGEVLKYWIEHPDVEFHFDNAVEIRYARKLAEYTGIEQVVGNTVCKSSGVCVTN